MARPSSLEEALKRYKDDILELDAFLFPDAWPLSLHQIYMYRKFERSPRRWVEWCRGAGKSSTISRYKAVKKIQSTRTVVYSGPSYRQSKHPFRYEKTFILNSPWLLPELAKDPTENTERSEIQFKNGSRSVALPASGTKIHGERATDLVITETFEYPKELYARTAKPMLMGGRIVGGRTVTWETAAGVQNSFAYQLRNLILKRILAGDPNYCFLAVDFEDLKNEGFVDAETIADVEADREIDEAIWQQQYLNLWLALTGAFYEFALLSREKLKAAQLCHAARNGKTYIVGGDVARSKRGKGDDSAIAVWEVDLKIPDARPGVVYAEKWNNRTADQLARDWAGILGRFDAWRLIMDMQGFGVSVYDKLSQQYGFVETDDDRPGRRIIMQYPHTPAIINETHHSLRGAFLADSVLMPARPETDDLARAYDTVNLGLMQLADLQTKELPSGFYKFEEPPGRKSDVAQSLAYGWFGVRTLLQQAQPQTRQMGSPIVESDLARTILLGDNTLGTTLN